MERKELGKISDVKFGHVGYQEVCIGLRLTFEFEGSGICTDISTWDPEMIECNERSEWTEDDRDRSLANIMREISEIMKDAKIDDLYKLKGKPVEVIIENQMLKDWRILTEVL